MHRLQSLLIKDSDPLADSLLLLSLRQVLTRETYGCPRFVKNTLHIHFVVSATSFRCVRPMLQLCRFRETVCRKLVKATLDPASMGSRDCLHYVESWSLQLVAAASCFRYVGPLLSHLVAFSYVRLLVAFSYERLDCLCYVGHWSPPLWDLDRLRYRTFVTPVSHLRDWTFVTSVGHFGYMGPLLAQLNASTTGNHGRCLRYVVLVSRFYYVYLF